VGKAGEVGLRRGYSYSDLKILSPTEREEVALLVTDPSKNPVGLLYAGTSNGKTAIANRIDLVLTGLSAQSGQTLSVDGD